MTATISEIRSAVETATNGRDIALIVKDRGDQAQARATLLSMRQPDRTEPGAVIYGNHRLKITTPWQAVASLKGWGGLIMICDSAQDAACKNLKEMAAGCAAQFKGQTP